MHKLIVELKQHTPIIHFQAHQKGATLRGSEIKPLINKYLEKKYHNKYQIKVSLYNSRNAREPDRNNLLFFGNQGITNELKKKKTLEDQDITLEIETYFDEELKKKIAAILPVALALNNFGNRKNKGTGCYFPVEKSRYDFENILKEHVCKKNQHKVFYWDWVNNKDIYNVIYSIRLFYSLLKSGITIKSKEKSVRTDYPSLLYQYFLNTGITWERAKIKKDWSIGHDTRTELPKSHSDNFKFIRAVLGTGDIQSWMSEGITLKVEFPKEFDRIPSSLFFKIFTNEVNSSNARVYFWTSDSYKEILNKKFEFSCSPKRNITIESPGSFNMEEFLNDAIINIHSLIIRNNDGVDTQKKIEEINKKISTLSFSLKDEKENLIKIKNSF